MSMYTQSKAVLEFRFAGEKGLGAGVTASFYSAVAAELQRRNVNSKVLQLSWCLLQGAVFSVLLLYSTCNILCGRPLSTAWSCLVHLHRPFIMGFYYVYISYIRIIQLCP